MMSVETAVFVAGLIIGSVIVLGAAFVWVRHHKYGFSGAMMTLGGIILVGLSIWARVTIQVGEDGVTASFERIQDQVVTVAQMGEAIKTEVAKVDEKVEAVRQELLALSQAMTGGRQPTAAELGSLRRRLQEVPQVDFRQFEAANSRLETLMKATPAGGLSPD